MAEALAGAVGPQTASISSPALAARPSRSSSAAIMACCSGEPTTRASSSRCAAIGPSRRKRMGWVMSDSPP